VFDDISLLVPSSWQLIDLPHQDLSHGFFPDPGTCLNSWFDRDFPRALVGNSDPHITVSCIEVEQWPITPTDGVWARDLPSDIDLGPVVARNTVNGLDISIVEHDLPDNRTISPVVDLVVRTASHTVRISVGVGLDASITRTIIESLRPT
jgi:hypothetical protein